MKPLRLFREMSLLILLLTQAHGILAQQKNDSLALGPNNSVERLIFLDSVIESKIFLAPKEAVRYAYEASTLVQSLPETELVAKTYRLIGDNYKILGIYDRALTLYSEGLKLALKNDFNSITAEIHLSIGELYLEQNILPLSMENFNRARDYFRLDNSLDGESRALQGDLQL